MQIHRNNDSSVITLSDRLPADHYAYRGTRIAVVTVFGRGFQLAGIKGTGERERLKSWGTIHPWDKAPELLGQRSHLSLVVWHEMIRYAPAAVAEELTDLWLRESKVAKAEQASEHLGKTITKLVTALQSREQYLQIGGEDHAR